MGLTMNIDHVTIATSNLDTLRETFAGLGLATDYGGPHANGVTHMALLGFDDGSYIELISTVEKPKAQSAYWWKQFIAEDGGPCAWAVGADDVAAEAERIAGLGIAVRGPQAVSRQRPDGKLIQWDSAFIGDGDPGATLPFIIRDRTPREWRVTHSASVAGSELRGIARVVVAVSDLRASSKLFHKVYGSRETARGIDDHLPAELQAFDNIPAVMACPLSDHSVMMSRLEQYGPCPLTFLIGSADMEQSQHRFPSAQHGRWYDQPVLWLPAGGDLPWLGIIST
jgi:catechol 2,3-dioxygenase-like lactoylglutathione lyase family enzyme